MKEILKLKKNLSLEVLYQSVCILNKIISSIYLFLKHRNRTSRTIRYNHSRRKIILFKIQTQNTFKWDIILSFIFRTYFASLTLFHMNLTFGYIHTCISKAFHEYKTFMKYKSLQTVFICMYIHRYIYPSYEKEVLCFFFLALEIKFHKMEIGFV